MKKFVITAQPGSSDRQLRQTARPDKSARQYENLVFSRDIYSRKLVKITTPELYVFYNGPQDAPVEQEMKLSDAFRAVSTRHRLFKRLQNKCNKSVLRGLYK